LTERQKLRRRVRDILVDLGAIECWTPTLGSDAEFDVLHRGVARVRITNPLAADESVMRATLVTSLVRTWARNYERGNGDVVVAEIGNVFAHPSVAVSPRLTRGGEGGSIELALPEENERVTVVLGRPNDDATTAVALWATLAKRLGLEDVVVRTCDRPPKGLHPTRCASLVDRASGAELGFVGEVDSDVVESELSASAPRRLGLLDVDFDALCDRAKATRRSEFASMPSKYPSAAVDLAFVTPRSLHAQDLANTLRLASAVVESVELFDVYEGSSLPEGTRSLAYSVRFSSSERTLSEAEVASARNELITAAASLGATLR
jgi:phenylalanyl-tRNA synthetase beta chain